MDQSGRIPPLHLPDGLNYECIRCGRSCGEFLEIPVEPEAAAALRALCADPRSALSQSATQDAGETPALQDSTLRNPQSATQDAGETPALQDSALRAPRSALEQSAIRNPQSATQDAGGTPALQDSALRAPRSALEQSAIRNPQSAIIESPWSPGQLIMRQENGRCCLQRPDGLCAVHAACGFAAKPAVCRSFPYKFIETPSGVFVGLSFACTAVLGNQGPPVAAQLGPIREAWAARSSHTHRRVVADPLLLTEYLPLSWEQYELIEEDLGALLDPALGPIGQRLVMQAIYLRLLVNFLREAREQAGTRLEGPAAHNQALGVFHARVRQPGSELFALLRRTSARHCGSPMLRRMVLGFAHVLRTTYTQRRGRLASYWLATSQYLRFAAGRGTVELPGLAPVPWARLAAVGFDPARPDFDELLTRYFRHRLFRKDLAVADTVQTAHHMHLMHWGLIHWYAAARAAAAGAPRIELQHLADSVRFMESHCVFHSSFDKMFSHYPMLRGFMDRLFLNPHYAFAMGWGEWVSPTDSASRNE